MATREEIANKRLALHVDTLTKANDECMRGYKDGYLYGALTTPSNRGYNFAYDEGFTNGKRQAEIDDLVGVFEDAVELDEDED